MMSYFIRFKAVITAIGAGILQEGFNSCVSVGDWTVGSNGD